MVSFTSGSWITARQAGAIELYGRRAFMGLVGGTAAETAFAAPVGARFAAADAMPGHYDVDRSFANFDAAYYGAMTRTAAMYRRHGEWVNRNNALFLRSALPGPTAMHGYSPRSTPLPI
jgi:hypothetical protein